MALKSAEDYRCFYQDCSGTLDVTTTTGDTTLVTVKTNHTIYIQSILFYVTTDASQSISFEDNNSTIKQLAVVPTSPGDDTKWEFPFGDEGFPLTQEKSFVMNVSAVGIAGNLKWYGYQKLTKVAAA